MLKRSVTGKDQRQEAYQKDDGESKDRIAVSVERSNKCTHEEYSCGCYKSPYIKTKTVCRCTHGRREELRYIIGQQALADTKEQGQPGSFNIYYR